MAIIFRILFAALLLCSNVYALEPMRVNQSGDPHVEVFVSDSTKFMDDWVNTPSSYAPVIKRVKEARFNQMVHAGIVISGFGIDSSSKVDFVVGVEIIAPNGAVFLKDERFAVHKGQFKGKGIIMANKVLDMEFEPNDPVGAYTIKATIIDNIAKKRVSGSTNLTIKP